MLCVLAASSAVGAQDPLAAEPDQIVNPPAAHTAGVHGVPSPPAPIGTLLIEAVGFRDDRGQALVALFRKRSGFPRRIANAYWKGAFPIDRRHIKVTIANVASGIVAAVVIHDSDKDGALDTGRFGFRLEGYGTSRDARSRIGAPDFYDAAVALKPGEQMYLRVPLRY